MPPLHDDETIDPDQSLLRALRPGWTALRDDGAERPNRLAFTDGSQETSCFIDNEVNLAELRRLFPDAKICRFRARHARAVAFVLERKPSDCPDGFAGDPTHHLVIGPAMEISKRDLMRRGDTLCKMEGIEILPPLVQEEE